MRVVIVDENSDAEPMAHDLAEHAVLPHPPVGAVAKTLWHLRRTRIGSALSSAFRSRP